MSRKNVVRGEGTTRQSILAAATERFASASYDDVSLRDLAADVGVDVSYVHRSFGSKENLFRKVLEVGRVDTHLAEVEAEALSGYLARMLFERSQVRGCGELDPLAILVRSLMSPTAGRLVGERLQVEFIEPMQRKMKDATSLRASMVISLLIGFSILRNLLQLPAAAEIEPAQAEQLIAHVVEEILKLDIGGDRGGA